MCRTFTPPPGCGSPGSGLSLCAPSDTSSAAHALAAEHVLLDHSYGAEHANEEAGAPARSLIVPFVACGDLAGFDSDASYPLELAAARASHAATDAGEDGAAATGADDGAEAGEGFRSRHARARKQEAPHIRLRQVGAFIEEHGREPGDADKQDDEQWVALSGKAQYYRSLVHVGGGAQANARSTATQN